MRSLGSGVWTLKSACDPHPAPGRHHRIANCRAESADTAVDLPLMTWSFHEHNSPRVRGSSNDLTFVFSTSQRLSLKNLAIFKLSMSALPNLSMPEAQPGNFENPGPKA